MPFAVRLHDSLQDRRSRVADEFAAGDSLEAVLTRHLLAVEATADTQMLTSVLLLDESGTRVLHGAAPSLPQEYCDAIHGMEIGPRAGSCGTAAYTGRPTYVTDVATDPLWEEYRHIALPHGLRACWSTPIFDPQGEVIGTFAVYHLTSRSPTPDEVRSIRMITDHVAQAILWARSHNKVPGVGASERAFSRPGPSLVGDNDSAPECSDREAREQVSTHMGRLQGFAERLDRYSGMVESKSLAVALRALASDCRKLGGSISDFRKDPGDDH